MAVDSYDPTTGAPVFLDSGAPDIAVDPSAVAAFAASVGTRPIGTTSQRNAYAYAREGLAWYDTTEDAEYVHNGTSWALNYVADGSLAPVLGSGWAAPTTNVLSRRGGWAQASFNGARGATALGIGGVVLNVPATYRGASNVWGLAWGLGGATNPLPVYLDAATNQVKINVALGADQAIAFTLMWRVTS